MRPTFMPYPPEGVHMASRDGAYLLELASGDKAQVVVVGPVLHTPGEYESGVREKLGWHESEPEEIIFIPVAPDEDLRMRVAMMRRGFYSFIFKKVP